MGRRAVVLAMLIATMAALPQPARATGGPIVAAPGSYMTTYTTAVIVWTPGSPLMFTNADIQGHDVVSNETRAPGTAPWCPANGPRCPLFFAEEIVLGESAEVQGLDDVEPGVYPFRCSPHTWMEGTLVVV